ncbi:DinB family protein [Hymenobacter sp. NBH84]|uniref:DinB family protein n=1 Tax=Hymenobacter defluvii TaxID=2054411 RepID=A0ABS3THN8_9BACT|nr:MULTISPECIES: DinB family protein [Hymenobacter]MBO3272888.1 DinB family protein [Hymenobacter defluvii]QNE40523.1 DinB family protein [Hymenobacter sp. NBH84]
MFLPGASLRPPPAMSQPATRTTDFLDQLTADLRALQDTVAQDFRPLTDDQLNRRPGPGKWSVGQCLEHLNIIGGLYLPVIAHKLQQAQTRTSRPADTVKRGLVGRRLTEAMRVPASEKATKTPQQYAPSGSRLPRTVIEVFNRQADELLTLLQQAREVNINSIRIPNVVIPLLRLRLTDQLELLVVHAQRHIAQAERVLEGGK